MNECICSSCKNLKSVVDEETNEINYECFHGYPSEKCEECTTGECEVNCLNYLSDEAEDELVTVNCKNCGKELKKACKDEPEGDVLCVDCYLRDLL